MTVVPATETLVKWLMIVFALSTWVRSLGCEKRAEPWAVASRSRPTSGVSRGCGCTVRDALSEANLPLSLPPTLCVSHICFQACFLLCSWQCPHRSQLLLTWLWTYRLSGQLVLPALHVLTSLRSCLLSSEPSASLHSPLPGPQAWVQEPLSPSPVISRGSIMLSFAQQVLMGLLWTKCWAKYWEQAKRMRLVVRLGESLMAISTAPGDGNVLGDHVYNSWTEP